MTATWSASSVRAAQGLSGAAATVEVVRAEVRIGAALVKDVVGGDQDGVTDGDDGAALAAARGEAAILGGEVGPLGARGRPSGLDERAA